MRIITRLLAFPSVGHFYHWRFHWSVNFFDKMSNILRPIHCVMGTYFTDINLFGILILKKILIFVRCRRIALNREGNYTDMIPKFSILSTNHNKVLYSGPYHVTSGIAEVKRTLCLLSTAKQKQKGKQRGSSERTSVSSKTNFGRNTYSARFIILVGLYHLS